MKAILKVFIWFLNKFTETTNFIFYFRGTQRPDKILKLLGHNKIEELVDEHFRDNFNGKKHVNHDSVKRALLYFFTQKGSKCILETGSSAWGFNSTVLFDKIVALDNKNNGVSYFLTCDIRWDPALELRNLLSSFTKLYVADSVKFFKILQNPKADNYFVYLDSYDLDFRNPEPSGLHGLKEFIACSEFFKKGTVLLIDDTPSSLEFVPEEFKSDAEMYYRNYGVMPGKGMFVVPILDKHPKFQKIHHEYQVCYVWE